MTSVREIMTSDAQCVGENETLETAAKKMRDLDVGQLPICGGNDRLAGILTDRDIVIQCLAQGGDPKTTTAGELAKGKPVTITADASVEDAVAVMAENLIRRLPVIDNQKLVGIVSLADIARNVSGESVGNLVKLISRV